VFCSVSTIRCTEAQRKAYFALRRSEIEPAMMSAPGFIKRELLRNRSDPDRYLLLVYWESDEAAAAYRVSRIHDHVRDKTIALIGARPQTEDYDFETVSLGEAP
jgi:heme-degrading monooxygenase HmoA